MVECACLESKCVCKGTASSNLASSAKSFERSEIPLLWRDESLPAGLHAVGMQAGHRFRQLQKL